MYAYICVFLKLLSCFKSRAQYTRVWKQNLKKIYSRLNSESFSQCRCRPTAQTAAFRNPSYWEFCDS